MYFQTIPIYAAVIECIAVFISSFIAKLLAKVKFLDGVAGLLNAFLGTCLVLMGKIKATQAHTILVSK